MANSSFIRVALLDFTSIPSPDLQRAAESIVPAALRRRFKNEERARGHWAGRAVVAALLETAGQKLFVVPDPEYGYLQLRDAKGNASPFHCNISHTESVAVASLAEGPVGIDVENLKRNADKVLQRVATDEERATVAHYALKFAATNPGIVLWSAKEAFSKALGLGMKFGFQKFHVDLTQGPPFAAQTEIQGPLAVAAPVVEAHLFGERVVTVCLDRALQERSQWEWRELSALDLPR